MRSASWRGVVPGKAAEAVAGSSARSHLVDLEGPCETLRREKRKVQPYSRKGCGTIPGTLRRIREKGGVG